MLLSFKSWFAVTSLPAISFPGAVELTRIRVSDRNTQLLERGTHLFRHFPARLAQLPLLGHVAGERIDIGLAGVGCAVADHKHVPALLQRRNERGETFGLRVHQRRHRSSNEDRCGSNQPFHCEFPPNGESGQEQAEGAY